MRAATPAGEIAAQHITQLNERIETLTSKLIASDKEKNSLRAQLDGERQRGAEATEGFEQKTRIAAKELEIVQQENDKIRRVRISLCKQRTICPRAVSYLVIALVC
jgi:predicted  nucleic acid-binding Zn-ribbon protein